MWLKLPKSPTATQEEMDGSYQRRCLQKKKTQFLTLEMSQDIVMSMIPDRNIRKL